MAVDQGDNIAKIHQTIFIFNGEYGYEQDLQKAINILSSCDGKIAEWFLEQATWMADESFGSGLHYKLQHLESF